jgi:hypothetical protein
MERRKRKGQGLLDFSFMKSINWVHSIRHPLGERRVEQSQSSLSASILQPNQSHGSRNPMVGLILGQAPTPAAQAICEGILVEIG